MKAKAISLALYATLLLGADGGGCNNGVVGVQDYGTITGRVVDSTTKRPVPDALVSVGSLFIAHSDGNGVFTLTQIPIGTQNITARAPAYQSNGVSVRVKKDQTVAAELILLTPVGQTPPPTPTPEPTDTP